MKWKTFAIVTITFAKKKLAEEDLQLLEGQLRKFSQVDHLVIEAKEIEFYIWGQENIDYSVIAKLKESLKSRHYEDFKVFATEYAMKGRREV